MMLNVKDYHFICHTLVEQYLQNINNSPRYNQALSWHG